MVLFNFVGWGGDARAEKKNVRKDGGSGYRIERGQRQAATTRNTITNTSRNTNTNADTNTDENTNKGVGCRTLCLKIQCGEKSYKWKQAAEKVTKMEKSQDKYLAQSMYNGFN